MNNKEIKHNLSKFDMVWVCKQYKKDRDKYREALIDVYEYVKQTDQELVKRRILKALKPEA